MELTSIARHFTHRAAGSGELPLPTNTPSADGLHIRWPSQSAGEFGSVFLPAILRVGGNFCPNEMSRVTPVVEQNTLFERLASGRDYDDIMLAAGVG